MEALQREVARLKDENKIEKEKAKKARGLLDKEREGKVHDDLLNLYASNAKALSSNLLSQFGPEGKPKKDVGTKSKISQKGDSKLGSPAKRLSADNSHPAPADPQYSRTLPSSKGAGQSKMHLKQGFHSGGKNSTYTDPRPKQYPLPPKEYLAKSNFQANIVNCKILTYI